MSLDESIAEIRREIIETHNLIIKTDNLIKSLSSEIKQIEKRQERYERKYIFNSVVAYVIFVIIIFGGLYVAFDAKVGAVRREKEALEQKLERTSQLAEQLQEKLALHARQEKVSEQFLRLKEQGQGLDALKAVEKLEMDKLSPLLKQFVGQQIEKLREDLAARALEQAREHLRQTNLKRALYELDRALEINPPAAVLVQIHRLRANALSKLNRNAAAAEAFLAAVQADPQAPGAESDLYQAAGFLEASGDVPRALEFYRRLADNYPASPLAPAARKRLEKLSPQPGGSAPAPAPTRRTPTTAAPAPAEARSPGPSPAAPPPAADDEE